MWEAKEQAAASPGSSIETPSLAADEEKRVVVVVVGAEDENPDDAAEENNVIGTVLNCICICNGKPQLGAP